MLTGVTMSSYRSLVAAKSVTRISLLKTTRRGRAVRRAPFLCPQFNGGPDRGSSERRFLVGGKANSVRSAALFRLASVGGGSRNQYQDPTMDTSSDPSVFDSFKVKAGFEIERIETPFYTRFTGHPYSLILADLMEEGWIPRSTSRPVIIRLGKELDGVIHECWGRYRLLQDGRVELTRTLLNPITPPDRGGESHG